MWNGFNYLAGSKACSSSVEPPNSNNSYLINYVGSSSISGTEVLQTMQQKRIIMNFRRFPWDIYWEV